MTGEGDGVEAALKEIRDVLESHKVQLAECVDHIYELRHAVESVTDRLNDWDALEHQCQAVGVHDMSTPRFEDGQTI